MCVRAVTCRMKLVRAIRCSGSYAVRVMKRAGRGKMVEAEEQIRALVDAETAAWNARDADALVALFHPGTVWPWPPNSRAHDPLQWVMPFGRFDRVRWRRSWQELFDTHDLVHNKYES